MRKEKEQGRLNLPVLLFMISLQMLSGQDAIIIEEALCRAAHERHADAQSPVEAR